MSKINIAVVEDEADECELICNYIRRFSQEQQVDIEITTFSDGVGLTSPYKAGYDLILMDIQMQVMDGLTAARKIREKDESVVIIFITNLAQYAIKGYSVGATNFVIKPVNFFAFSEELKKALLKINKKQRTAVLLPGEDGIHRVNIADIHYAETVGRTIILHTAQGDYHLNDTLNHLEERLNDPRFFRCHRAFLINIYSVERVRDHDILIQNSTIPLSRYRRKEFEDALIRIMGETI